MFTSAAAAHFSEASFPLPLLRTQNPELRSQKPEAHLLMVGAQHDPATEGVAQVDHAGAAAEAQDFGKGDPHGQD